jgi:hypothetical protein
MTETNEADFIEIKGPESEIVKWFLANKSMISKVTEKIEEKCILTV